MKLVIVPYEELKSLLRSELKLLESAVPTKSQRYNLAEAAEYLGIPVPTFRIHQSRIGGTKIGKRWYFNLTELDHFIESNRRKTLEEIRKNI